MAQRHYLSEGLECLESIKYKSLESQTIWRIADVERQMKLAQYLNIIQSVISRVPSRFLSTEAVYRLAG